MLISPVDLFQKSVHLFLRHKKTFFIYIGLVLILSLPSFLISTFYNPEELTGGSVATLFVVQAISYILNLWVSNGLTQSSANLYQKNSSEMSSDLKHSWKRLLPAIGASILIGLAVLGGFFLLFIPAIIFGVWFSFSLQAVVLDSQSPVESMKTSKRLVKGRWWEVFWRLVAPILIIMAVYILIVMVLGVSTGILSMFSEQIALWVSIILVYLFWGLSMLLIPVLTIYYVILYLNLKETPVSQLPQQNDTATPPQA